MPAWDLRSALILPSLLPFSASTSLSIHDHQEPHSQQLRPFFMHRPNHIKQSQKLKSKSAKHQKINNTQYETKKGRRGAEGGLSRVARKPEVVTGEEGRRADQGGDGWWRCVKGRRPAGQRRRHPVEQRRREGRMRAGLRSQGGRGRGRQGWGSYNI